MPPIPFAVTNTDLQLALATLHVRTRAAGGVATPELVNITVCKVLKSSSDGAVASAGVRINAPATLLIKARFLNITDRLKLLVGRSRMQRQWRGASELRHLNLSVGRPLIHGVSTLAGKGVEVLVTEFVPGTTLLHHLRDKSLSGSESRHISREVARAIVAMVRRGRFNRDFKPSNLIVSEPEEGGMRHIAQIDTVAIRRCNPARFDIAPVHMLTCLMLEPIGCGCPPTTRQRLRLLRDVVTAWNDENDATELEPDIRRSGIITLGKLVAAEINAHGDPRPRDNPLG